jgi:calcineurin-like phosphoesterase
MRLLFIGDIVGRPGRAVVANELSGLRERLAIDFVIGNGENAAGGFGLTRKSANELFACGIDVLTTGNHWADQKEILTFIGDEDRILRPRNYPEETPGRGVGLYDTRKGQRVLVINVMAATRSLSICMPRRRRKKWRWATSATRAQASS